MKIEKINENKIRCILTRDDLEVRHMKISEIAYGSEKARSLFRDMMEQASHQFGFEADNIPLMIEAIPMPNECIILDITKVSDPEELDTRFSRFSQSSVEPGEELPIPKDFLPDGADEVIDLFQNCLLYTSGGTEPCKDCDGLRKQGYCHSTERYGGPLESRYQK